MSSSMAIFKRRPSIGLGVKSFTAVTMSQGKTVAVVELKDGQVKTFPPDKIKFLDQPELPDRCEQTPAPMVLSSGLKLGAAEQTLNETGVATTYIVIIVVSWIICGFLGMMVGSRHDAAALGRLVGFHFGPLGVTAALALDRRESCPHCGGRLNGRPSICQYCRSELTWEGAARKKAIVSTPQPTSSQIV